MIPRRVLVAVKVSMALVVFACAYAALLILALAWSLLVPIAQSPDVYWSVTRDECVRVDPPDRGQCDALPAVYNRIPVR